MGTNYYLCEKLPCKECGRPYEPKHIGKSSGGWCFALHVIPEEGINDLEDWEKLWDQYGMVIVNQYGKRLVPSEMLSIITERCGLGHNESDQWYRENEAIRGPNGLVRSRIDGTHCIGHGKGTWDLIIGEFS